MMMPIGWKEFHTKSPSFGRIVVGLCFVRLCENDGAIHKIHCTFKNKTRSTSIHNYEFGTKALKRDLTGSPSY